VNFNFKEIIRWISFIPLSFFSGGVIGVSLFLILIGIFGVAINPLTGFIIITPFWITTLAASAYLKPINLTVKVFKRIWLFLISLFVVTQIIGQITSPMVGWIAQIINTAIPFIIYRWMYYGQFESGKNIDNEQFRLGIRYFLIGFLNLNDKEDKAKGAVGWRLPTIGAAAFFFIYIIIQTFSGFPLAFLSLIGVVCEHTAVCTGVYSKDPSLTFEKYNFIKRSLLALSVFLLGVLLVRLGGITTVQFSGFTLSAYLVPPLIALTYFPGDGLKE